MVILGLAFDYHDAAAAILVDGDIAFAAEEERYSRIKHDRRIPTGAVQAALHHTNLRIDDIDAVVFYEKPLVKFGRIFNNARSVPNREAYIDDSLRYWIRHGKFSVAERITHQFGVPADRIFFVAHHESHAASTFFCSSFEDATVITLDGIGEYESATVSIGQGIKLNQVHSMRYPNSVGLFYSAMTAFLGFEVNEGEYKVMGMAGFGQAIHADKIRKLIFDDDNSIRIDQTFFDFHTFDGAPYKTALTTLLGLPRQPESPFEPDDDSAMGEMSRKYADIAASVQTVAEEAILMFVRSAIQKTGIDTVAMAGGVALNSLANGRIQRELGVPLYVHPSPGDAGGALGAALHYHCVGLGHPRPKPMSDPFLGSQYSQEDVFNALEVSGVKQMETFPDQGTLCERVAGVLAQGKVVGWFQGRFEWGPRALGARSILANPTIPDMKRMINEKIKFRESFRPFAPAVLSEHAAEYFDICNDDCEDSLAPECFMLSVRRVRPEKTALIPAVTHVDGTARVQLVHKSVGSPLRTLIERFFSSTGVPLLLNTSFNRRGEPMVGTPKDAVTTFLYSGLDCLVIQNTIAWKV